MAIKFSEWTNPALGGNLNTKGHSLVSDAGQDIPIAPGSGGVIPVTGDMRFYGGSPFEQPATIGIDRAYTELASYENVISIRGVNTTAQPGDTLRGVRAHLTAEASLGSMIAIDALVSVDNAAALQYATRGVSSLIQVSSSVAIPSDAALSGVYGALGCSGSGSIAIARGVESSLYIGGTGDVDAMTLFHGVMLLKNWSGETGVAGTVKGLDLSISDHTGDITDLYGIYIDSSWVGATNKAWAIYSESTAPSLLSGSLDMPNAETSDPHVAGRVWNNAGVATFSAG